MSKNNICIAVIDDDPVILRVFSSILSHAGLRADYYDSPSEAFNSIIADSTRYDLIIADILMPQEDGVSFVKRVRRHCPKLPVMFMTGGVTLEMKKEALSLGEVAFLEKPFPLMDVLSRTIRDFLKIE